MKSRNRTLEREVLRLKAKLKQLSSMHENQIKFAVLFINVHHLMCWLNETYLLFDRSYEDLIRLQKVEAVADLTRPSAESGSPDARVTFPNKFLSAGLNGMISSRSALDDSNPSHAQLFRSTPRGICCNSLQDFVNMFLVRFETE